MPTSSGGSYRYYSPTSTIKTTRSRPLPAGPGPLDHTGRKISIDTLPSVSTRRKSSTNYPYSGRDIALVSTSKYGNSGGSSSYQPNYLNSTLHDTHSINTSIKKLDINDNSYGSSYNSQYSPYSTSSNTYGSHTQYGRSSHSSTGYQPSNIITSKLSSSSRSSSVESTHYQSSNSKTSQLSVGAQNRNDSCSSRISQTDVDIDEKGAAPVGLVNLGNTCFMNSVLQCLLNTKSLIEYVLSSKRASDVNKTTSSMKGALMEAFSDLVHKMWRSNGQRSISTKELKSKVQRFAPRFSGYNQQDAQEFLRYLLQGLHEDVNRVKTKPKYIESDDEAEQKMRDDEKAQEYWRRYLNFDNSAIVDIFVGQLKSTLTCQTCQYKSVTFDPFWDLSLPIPKSRSTVDIQDCMESFMKEEILDGDERPTCARCKTHRKCTKSFKIQRLPKILVLHLKRFSGERFRQKLSTAVNFDLKGFSLKKFVVDNHQEATYDLYGISNHVGSVYSGHYTAYCKHPHQTRWYSYNDSHVDSVSERRLVSDEAYVLFYQLVK